MLEDWLDWELPYASRAASLYTAQSKLVAEVR
jgi:hypothetical protein